MGVSHGTELAMLIVLSPSKALDFTAPPVSAPLTTPELAEHTRELSKTTKKLRSVDLKRLMDLSDDLAKLNRERFQAFDPDSEEGLQAAFAFNGDVYMGLKARELDKKALAFAQKHVRILSGLYGVLRPLDAIQPYRLEMGVRLKTKRGASLYDFWADRVAASLNEAGQGHQDKVLVNCASQEYFGAVDVAALKMPVVTCRFLEAKDADLRGFDVAGYSFDKAASSDAEFTFTRPQPAPLGRAKAR